MTLTIDQHILRARVTQSTLPKSPPAGSAIACAALADQDGRLPPDADTPGSVCAPPHPQQTVVFDKREPPPLTYPGSLSLVCPHMQTIQLLPTRDLPGSSSKVWLSLEHVHSTCSQRTTLSSKEGARIIPPAQAEVVTPGSRTAALGLWLLHSGPGSASSEHCTESLRPTSGPCPGLAGGPAQS